MKIPHFKYRTKESKMQFVIEFDGEVVHKINDLSQFHQSLGYTEEMAKSGILPDEYIWDKYTHNTDQPCKCFHLRIFNYLSKHSDRFKDIYTATHSNWNSVLVMSKLCGNAKCTICKSNQILKGA